MIECHAVLICPTGKKTSRAKNLSRPARKNIPLFTAPKSVASSRHPASSKRGVRVVTNIEAGCGGRGSVEKTSDAAADGEVVWSWRSNAGAKSRNDSEATVATKQWSPGKSRISRKTIAQGRPGIFG
jgi:hypothetical protein